MHIKQIAVLAVVICAVALLAAPSVADAPGEIKALQSQIRLLKAENKMLRATVESLREDLKEKDLKILRLKEQVRRPKIKTATRPAGQSPNPVPPIKLLAEFEDTLKLHQAAMVKSAKVLQIISKTEMIIEIGIAYRTGILSKPSGTIFAVWRYKSATVWLSGIDTKGVVDGAQAKINKTLYVADTKRYVNALGTSKTIFLLKPLPAEWEAKLPKPAIPNRKTKKINYRKEREQRRPTRRGERRRSQ